MATLVSRVFPQEYFEAMCFEMYESMVRDELPPLPTISKDLLFKKDAMNDALALQAQAESERRSSENFTVKWGREDLGGEEISSTTYMDYLAIEVGTQAFNEEKDRVDSGEIAKYRQLKAQAVCDHYALTRLYRLYLEGLTE